METERSLRIQKAMQAAGLAAVVCALPSNVLLLTGYWPVVGNSIAICVCGGPTALLVPEDELEFTEESFANSVDTFLPGIVNSTSGSLEAVRPRLAAIFHKLKIPLGPIGIERHGSSQAASYLAIHLYGDDLQDMLRELLPASSFVPVEKQIQNLKSVKTAFELGRIRQACATAKAAYGQAAPQLRAGMSEPEAAQLLRAPLSSGKVAGLPVLRRDGFAFCMSGPNSDKASAAFAQTRSRVLQSQDLVMMHCNSYVDGFWTDITRTYTLQPPDARQAKMYAAVFAGRKAALDAIKPGARAETVDAAARAAIQDSGLGMCLRHGTGHGVGFSPMSAQSLPRVHAGSPDVLQEGMVFNIEPAVYIKEFGGVRHCDMVAVTASGYELLTPFQENPEDLTIVDGDSLLAQRMGSRTASRSA
ncbi:MAG: Xaa-Pro peptidase family protein [Candidatus Acidiferrales bacterium]